MTNDNTPDNLRKFLESDDPATVMMGQEMGKGLVSGFERNELIEFFNNSLRIEDGDEEWSHFDHRMRQLAIEELVKRKMMIWNAPTVKDFGSFIKVLEFAGSSAYSFSYSLYTSWVGHYSFGHGSAEFSKTTFPGSSAESVTQDYIAKIKADGKPLCCELEHDYDEESCIERIEREEEEFLWVDEADHSSGVYKVEEIGVDDYDFLLPGVSNSDGRNFATFEFASYLSDKATPSPSRE